jgi:ribosomal protein L22
MPYTFESEKPHAKAFGNNLRISAKDSQVLCKAVRRKKLSVVKRLLQDLIAGKRTLDTYYYTKAAEGMLSLLESCEANAKARGLDAAKLFVHASATHGSNLRRARRKSGFGAKMKSTNLEIILIERGHAPEIAKK